MKVEEIMNMPRWKVTVMLSNNVLQVIFIEADTSGNASAMIESMYGVGSIRSGPTRV